MKKLISILLISAATQIHAADILSHTITVDIKPDAGQIHVLDAIQIPEYSNIKNIKTFSLNGELSLLNSSVPLKPDSLRQNNDTQIQNDFGTRAREYTLDKATKKLPLKADSLKSAFFMETIDKFFLF